MPRINVYLPDDLAQRVRDADINVSAVAQEALRRELAVVPVDAWLDSLGDIEPLDVSHDDALEAIDAAREDFERSA